MQIKPWIFLLLSAVFGLNFWCQVYAQNNRVSTYNRIGWYNLFGTVQTGAKTSIHLEYQWRRNEVITEWQQSLLRIGINYKVNKDLLFRAGYAWIETYPYGDIPLNSFGKTFSEHRIFQMIQLNQQVGVLDFNQRLISEQRWIGSFASATQKEENKFVFLNRIRYLLRADYTFSKETNSTKKFYVGAYNELFIGFGKNVNANIFDQNRLGLVAGVKLSPLVKFEAGYLNQILQLGRQISGKNVFQYNNGIIVNVYFQVPKTTKSLKS